MEKKVQKRLKFEEKLSKFHRNIGFITNLLLIQAQTVPLKMIINILEQVNLN